MYTPVASGMVDDLFDSIWFERSRSTQAFRTWQGVRFSCNTTQHEESQRDATEGSAAVVHAVICARLFQDWKSQKYRDLIGSGGVAPRPGVLRLMDEARSLGLKVAVCSAATKGSVVVTLESLLGKERFAALDCFLAGDDVDKKKPDPTIYLVAASALCRARVNTSVTPIPRDACQHLLGRVR